MDNKQTSKNIPTVFIIFGATGDLMTKKIVPALLHLYIKGKLPKLFKIIGFSRRELTEDEFKNHVLEIIKKHDSDEAKTNEVNNFINLISYQKGRFDDINSYKMLASTLGITDKNWNVCSNKLFYLAVPPEFNKTIFENLHSSGLTIPCGPDEGWTRVIVEKPFGKNFETAEKLDNLLGKLFKEEQIYRIDHYLAKEMLQNILTFRFANSLFEDVWNKNYIERIDIKLLEDIGVEQRGTFYDGLGALRDVGQNHLLQMLALITMDQPSSFESEPVREKRTKLLSYLKVLTEPEIKKYTFRAQYKGYKKIKGVDPKSQTETYFRTIAYLASDRWEGIPVYMESGKRLERKKEIIVTFKHPEPCMCPRDIKEHFKNRVIFSLEPEESISVEFWSKKPGLDYKMEQKKLHFLFRPQRAKSQYVEEYEKLLLDCITGNQLLFISTDEIRNMWKYIDPITASWEKNSVPLEEYIPDQKNAGYSFEENKTTQNKLLKKEIGVIGLGKMGGNIVRRLIDKNWRVVGYNRSIDDIKGLEKEGMVASFSISELVGKLEKPRIILMMLPAGKVIDETLFKKDGIVSQLDKGDYLIDGANSYFKDTIKRAREIKKSGVNFIDMGISGGPRGARNGGCLMIGGEKKNFEYLESLFSDLAQKDAFEFFGGAGAGHFVKMVHNGIEYGMMQSIAEGFDILKNSKYKLSLEKVAGLYNNGSVIESRLVGWLKDGFEVFGQNLKAVSGTVGHTGEGEWTIKTAQEMNIDTPSIKAAFNFRVESAKKPSFMGQLLSAMRNMFGGHKITSSLD